jgi:hypothetical protein
VDLDSTPHYAKKLIRRRNGISRALDREVLFRINLAPYA